MGKRGPKGDPDLVAYRELVGSAEYDRQYFNLWQKTRVWSKCDVRASGRQYTNSAEKLEALKKKYAGGVKREDVERLVERLLENSK